MRNKTVNQTQKVRFSRLGIDHVTEVLGLENLIGNVVTASTPIKCYNINAVQKRSLISVPTIWLGRFLRAILRIIGKGGSALPGLIIEKIDPKFLARAMKKMHYGVVLVSGTNGKTTTTHIIASLLERQGLQVFTNKTGSNFSRGIVSELVKHCSIFGSLRANVAVLELDEAYGVQFAQKVQPDVSVFLNVMRDQLDRFGELDYTTSLLKKIAKRTTKAIVLNREDSNIMNLESSAKKQVKLTYFGLSPELKPLFLNDDELYGNVSDVSARSNSDNSEPRSIYATADEHHHQDLVLFESYTKGEAIYVVNGHRFVVPEVIKGLHNAFNVAAAISATQQVLGAEIEGTKLVEALKEVDTAFGRGETIAYQGQDYELVLVKNPAGFRIALLSFEPDNSPVMIAINDDYADGRDISWLYDVDFNAFKAKPSNQGVQIITGNRGYDLSLKFAYTDNPVGITEPSIKKAFQLFTSSNFEGSVGVSHNEEMGTKSKLDDKRPLKRIYATYTAMLEIRALLQGKRGTTL